MRCCRPPTLASIVAVAACSLLAAGCGGGGSPRIASVASSTVPSAADSSSVRTTQAGPTSGTADCNSVTTCYTPHQFDVAYGVQPLLQRGIDGRGETVVLPELAESQLSPPRFSDLRQDFAAFDHLFRLPAPRLRFVSTFAGPKDPWPANGEEVGDAEMVHTIAPRAALTILLVKWTSLDSADQAVAASVAALRLGASEGGIISLSPAGQIGGEHCVDHAQLTQVNAALQADAEHRVTVVAATGESGAAGEPCALIDALNAGISSSFTPRKEVILVASDPLVLSVGARPSTRTTRPSPGSARPHGASHTAPPAPASRRRAGASANSSADPPTRTARRASVPTVACLMWPPTPTPTME
jgi:subtilase family serine protease